MAAPEMEKQWEVIFHDDFLSEYRGLTEPVQNKLVAAMLILREKGRY